MAIPYKVSVVVATYNRVALLKKCVEALRNQTLDPSEFEVIIVDDGSLDGTEGFLASETAHTSLNLRNFTQDRQGPAVARNYGIKEAKSDLIAFTDDDCVPAPDWLEHLIVALPKNNKCVGVGGRIVRVSNSMISRYIDHVESMQPPKNPTSGEVAYLVTANALYRRAALLQVGGFDLRITWPGGEDPDLSHRLREKGYFLRTAEQAIVRHHHRDTLRGLYKTFWYYGLGRSARLRLSGASGEERGWMSVLPQFARRSARYLFNDNLSVPERIGFSALCWVHLVGFHRGGVSNSQSTD